MGFHKRYINDAQVASIYQKYGTPGVVNWFTKGADAIITSGKLAREVNDLMKILVHDEEKGRSRISEVIASASNQKARES